MTSDSGDGKAQQSTWTEEQDDFLIKCWAENLLPRDIGALMGRTGGSISTRASRLKLPARERRGGALQMKAPPENGRAEGDPSARGKQRKCLRCGTPFWSTGFGNRICGKHELEARPPAYRSTVYLDI